MPPNVLLILADQQHADWLGCVGKVPVLTPHLDALAAEGLRCTEAWCQNPICTPSRVSILSGQYPHNHGYYGLSGPAPQRLPSLVHHYAAQGYRTGLIGKLHLPDHPLNWLAEVADTLIDIHRGTRSCDPSPWKQHLASRGLAHLDDHQGLHDLDRLGRHVNGDHDSRPSTMPLEECVEAWMVQQADLFVSKARKDGKPFFLELSFPRPHHGITPDQRFWDLYPDDLALPESFTDDASGRPPHFQDMARYLRERHEWGYEPKTLEDGSRRVWRGSLAAVSQNDYFIGRFLDRLRALDAYQDTIIIFTADHGAYHGQHGIMEKAPGICGRAVCRVPMIWRVPGLTRGGSTAHLVESVDMASTLPGLCGLPPLATAEGRDLATLLAGQDQPVRDCAVTELPWSKSLRFGQWRFVQYHRNTFAGEDHGELYHQDDPLERRNRYRDPACQDVVHEARRLLLEWLTGTSRVITAWPPPAPEIGAQGRPAFCDAGDGREPPDGLRRRLQPGGRKRADPRCYS